MLLVTQWKALLEMAGNKVLGGHGGHDSSKRN